MVVVVGFGGSKRILGFPVEEEEEGLGFRFALR